MISRSTLESAYALWRRGQPDQTVHPVWGNLDSVQREAWERTLSFVFSAGYSRGAADANNPGDE